VFLFTNQSEVDFGTALVIEIFIKMTSDFSEMKYKMSLNFNDMNNVLLNGDLELYRTTLIVQKVLAYSNTCQCQ
jgi:hypothetical protein